LQAWQSLYETEGVDILTAPGGQTYCLHDIQYLYDLSQGQTTDRFGNRIFPLSPRQAQAIRLFLFENIRETDVAQMMGVSITNPVASYATQGMVRLKDMIESGQVSRFQPHQLKEAS
jgi:DNA-directed RNA polymerase specialized sigma24 family protein